MADLVLGLAKSAVEGTLSMAKSAIEEEEKLQRSVQRDLMLISDEFEMMRSFLNVTKQHATDDMVTTLVRQVRNMALDVEDCIETAVHLDSKSDWWRRMLPSCILAVAPAAALHESVASMELLKARVEAMGQRNKRYGHIRDPSSKPIALTQQHSVANSTAFDVLIEARDATCHGLIELLGKDEGRAAGLQVISVWGSAGDLGTKSVIKDAYYNQEICKNFTFRAWVKLMHPFNPDEFIWRLLAQFYTNYCPQQGSTVDVVKPIEVMMAEGAGHIKEFFRQASTQRYLLILEGMSTMDDWDTIRAYLPDNNNGSCVIVHTQQLEVASFCIGHSYRVSELKRFSKDHSVCVFFKEDKEQDAKAIKQKAARLWLDKFNLVRVGREIDLNTFHLMAFQAADREVLFVWGVAGVGKTSVVKHAYCTEVLQQRHRFEKFGWVNVFHPFNLRELSRSLLLDLHSESLQHHSMLTFQDPIQECRDILHEHSCLVVIDGIKSTEEWNLIKDALEIGGSKSLIIVITNEERVATHCAMQSNSIFNVKVLEVDECLDLFKKVCEKCEKTDSRPMLTRTTELTMLHKCGGLPKIIVSVADFLCGLGSEDQMMLSDKFMHELQTNQASLNLQVLFSWVHSYFRTCPDFVKPCIFYLSIFPLNHIIRRRRLVRRWIAEGYSWDTKERTVEENTEESFSKLVNLSMIQLQGSTTALSFYGRMSLCHVNGFFREYILSRSMEENLVFSLEGRCSINSQRTGRHLAIYSSWDRDRNVFGSIDVSRLRSLTVFGEWRSFFISDKMRLLRVLDLEDALEVANKDLEQMVKFLPRLKFLSLRRCRNISHLPDSLGRLTQLQSLDIRDTSVTRLPKGIIKLQKLQYFRAGTTLPLNDDTGMVRTLPETAGTPSLSVLPMNSLLLCTRSCRAGSSNGGLVEAPQGIGRLTALHTLGVIDISVTRGRALLAELKNLTQLRKLGVSGVNQSSSQEFLSAISGHGHLQSLSMQLDENNQGCLDCTPSPPENLWCLKLYGQVDKLPMWFRHLGNLRKLNLQMTTMLPQDEIDILGHLPKLAILLLCFKVFPQGELQFGRRFSHLRLLEIKCDSSLHVVSFPTSGFPALEALKLHCYRVSSLQFSGLEHLRELKEVWLSGSYDEAFKQNLQNMLVWRGPNEIRPVLRLATSSPSDGNEAQSR